MRFVLILMSFFLSLQAGAVQTSKCPAKFTVSVPSIQKFSRLFIEERIGEVELHKDEYVEYDAIDFFLARKDFEKGFSHEFKLDYIKNSKCYYEQAVEIFGGLMNVKIIGSDSSPELVIDYTNSEEAYDDEQAFRELRMFAKGHSKNSSYSFKGSDLQIKTFLDIRFRYEPYFIYIPLGKARIN